MIIHEHEIRQLEGRSAGQISDSIQKAGWRWFHAHKDDVIISKLLGLITVRVKDLRFLFVLLFGEERFMPANGVWRVID